MEKHKFLFKMFSVSLIVVGLISNILIAMPPTDRFVKFKHVSELYTP